MLPMLLLSVFAAFCAAEKTLEKKPPWLGFGVVEPFSRVGVRGAEVIFDSLLGPKVADPDRIRLCDIMLPDADVTTLGFEATGSDEPRSRLLGKRGKLASVGVGGVFTMIGAMSPGGGVVGAVLVLIGCIFAVRGRSGEDVIESDEGEWRSGNIAPILEATLPRLLSADGVFSCVGALFSCVGELMPLPPARLSGLVFGLEPRRVRAFFIRPAGDSERFGDVSRGAFNVLVTSVGVECEVARLLVVMWKVAARGVGEPSN